MQVGDVETSQPLKIVVQPRLEQAALGAAIIGSEFAENEQFSFELKLIDMDADPLNVPPACTRLYFDLLIS